MKFHHIGYAISSLAESLDIFLSLGYKKVSKTERDELRKVEILFVENDGVLVELISPLSSDSPISNVLKRVGNSAYHICYEVDNINSKIAELRKMRFIVVEKPTQAIAINNRRVAFLYNPKYGLLELLEKT